MASPAKRLVVAVVAPIQRFFRLEAAGGIVLVVAAIAALACANSPLAGLYEAFVESRLAVGTVREIVNDGLMTAFFVVVGAEIKREVVGGELRTFRRAALPLVAAAGGMIVPALLYLAIAGAPAARRGWAIPTATDIAFALGCLTLVKRRVPASLFVFLAALAIFDDLGAILVIAVAYGSTTALLPLVAALALGALLVSFGLRTIESPWPYAVVGAALWFAISRTGVHPTLAGVVVGMSIPTTIAAAGTTAPAVERLVRALHGPVAFRIVPLFAFVNAGVTLGGAAGEARVTLGVAVALIVGKAAGVFGGAALAVRAGLTPLPAGARWSQLFGVALLGGVGFTMSLFITELAFPAAASEAALAAKRGILAGSTVSALVGLAVLRLVSGRAP